MQLEPREFFTIARQIEDHTDSTTYFVRAVVRNARTDTLLETVDLTDQGSQRHSKEYQVPADTSGLGFYITITTSVYTDSGFTAKSANYGDVAETYLVQARNAHLMGGGHSVFTDFGKMKKILDVGLDAQAKKFPQPAEVKDIDFQGMLNVVVQRLAEMVSGIKIPEIPEQKEVDLKPVTDAIENSKTAVISAVGNIDIPKQVQTDLTPVLEAIKNVEVKINKEDVDKAIEAVKLLEKTIGQINKESLPEMQELLRAFGNLKKAFVKNLPEEKPRKKIGGIDFKRL